MAFLIRRLRGCAWIALWAFVGSLALPVAGGHPAGDDDDGGCLVGTVLPGGGEPARVTAAGEARPDHCVFCHWLRAMSGVDTADAVAIVVPRAPSVLTAHFAGRILPVSDTAAAPRAPPAPFLA